MDKQGIFEKEPTGALKQLITIFENPKKINKAEEWKNFFLSETFLKEQYLESFADDMFQYLSNLHTGNNYTIHSLPSHFLLELAIAYALQPKKKQNMYCEIEFVSLDGISFYARKKIAKLWNMQEKEYSYPWRILYKPENLVRLHSFSDYIKLKDLNQKNYLTLENRSEWEEIIKNGYSKRNECLLFLYLFWIRTEHVPKCILESMYKEYNLKDIAHSSTKKLYMPLKQEILIQYPNIEEILYNPNNKVQMISNWHKELIKILSDHQANYNIGIYEDTEDIKKRVYTLFSKREWKEFQYDSELFGKMFSQLYNRKVVPISLAKELMVFYSQDRLWYDKDRVDLMLESLFQVIGFHRWTQEMNYITSPNYEEAGIEFINDKNADFWQYYFQNGFGFRSIKLKKGNDMPYAENNRCYLPSYIKNMYYPSFSWQKLFTKFDEKENAILDPVNIKMVLPDGNQLRVEFYLHYVLYFLNEELVFRPKYTFQEFIIYANLLEKTEQIFFLLAITYIKKEERVQAIKAIEIWLRRLPLYPLTISRIAYLLAKDNARDWEEKEQDYKQEMVQAVYYTEQERFCFRVVVFSEKIKIYYQQKFGWEAIKTVYREKEKKELEILQELKQPRPVLIKSVSLEDMEEEEKAIQVIEAWKEYNKYHKEKEGKEFGILQEKEESSKLIKEFFENDKEFLTESYCVLFYGPERKQKRLLCCVIYPTSYNSSSYIEYNVNILKKRIKENCSLIGYVGWEEAYISKEGLQCVAIGESGTYYAFDGFHIVKQESLAALLVKIFDFTKVCLVETYQGYLSISRFDHRLEYCYDKKDFLDSAYSIKETATDFFTVFTEAALVRELAKQLDEILEKTSSRPYIFHFRLEKARGGAYALNIFEQSIFQCHNEEEQQKFRIGLLKEEEKIVWKLWKHGIGHETILHKFKQILLWYMAYGTYGWKLNNCLEVSVSLTGFHGKIVKKEVTIYKNIDGIFNALRERTGMIAYTLTINKKRKPGLFDSKFGGLAYWEPKKEYPLDTKGTKLMLLAQINLDQNPMEALSLKHGMLQFFGSGEEIFCRGFGSWDNQDKFRVIYHDKIDYNITRKELKALGLPDSTDKDKGYIHMPISKELVFDVERQEVLMGIQDYQFKKEFKVAIKQYFNIEMIDSPYTLLDKYEIKEEISEEISNEGHWILGYPSFAIKDPRKKQKELRKYDRLLFQFDVHYLDENDYYFDHGGCGIAHFFICEEDLKRKDFNHVMYHWECCDETE